MSSDEPIVIRRPRLQRLAIWVGRWVWRALVVLAVVGLLNLMTRRVEGIRSFGGTNCQVRLMRSYNGYGLFEATHEYFIRFGGKTVEPGQTISRLDDGPALFELNVDTYLTVMEDITVTFRDTEMIARLPRRRRHPPDPLPVVEVRVPFTLCGTTRGTLGDG
jgi:hypothetical protein